MRSRNFRQIGFMTMAVLAMVLLAGCKHNIHTPTVNPPPPPPPPPPVAATATISVNPTSIERGQSATLTWSTTDATSVSIDNGVGTVQNSGSQSIRPTQSTTYRITATGAPGTAPASASARITVTNPPDAPRPTPPPTRNPSEEELFASEVKTIYFDYNGYDVRADQQSTLQGNVNFFRQHPNVKVVIEGHCDERGSAEYNLGLGDKRANSLKEAMIAAGISADRIRTLSYGKERPVCTDANPDEACYQKNRRGQFVMDR
jgi:peptidoglycan-associated lipoprotein